MTEVTPAKTNSKKLRKTGLVLAAAALGILAIGTVAFAEGPHGRHGRGGGKMFPGMRMMRMLHSIDLTEEQEIKAVRVKRKLRKQAKAMRQANKASMSEAINELSKPTPDKARLHAIVDKSMASAAKLAHAAIDQFLEVHATLTSDQRQQLVENARQAKERMQNRKARRFRE